MDRRRFLALGAGSVAAGVVATRAVGEETSHPIVNGSVLKIDSESDCWLTLPDGSAQYCHFTPASEIWRGNTRSELSDFVPGDEVVVFGAFVSSRVEATGMETLYRAIGGEVTRRERDDLILDDYVLRLTDQTRGAEASDGEREYHSKNPGEIRAGDRVLAWARFDPSVDVSYVVEIATAAR